MNINNNILKKKTFWFFVAVLVVVVGIVMVIGANQLSEYQYQFPLNSENIEKVLAEQGIDMYIKENNFVDDSRSIAILNNEGKITFGIDSQVRENHKVLNMSWYLPKTLSSDQVYDFFYNDFSKQLEMAGIFYGNKKGINKELNKMLNYYLDEKNYNNKLDWKEKIGNDHLMVRIKPMLDSQHNQIISLLIIPDELYDDYLETLNNSKELAAQDIAKDFITDLFTVNAKEVENYKSIINLSEGVKTESDVIKINDEMLEKIQKNDEFLISLMTDEAYNTLVKNKENLKFTVLCYEGNYIIQVSEIQLSENLNDIENNQVGYNYQLQLKYISQDGSKSIGSVKGLIELGIIDGSWKVTGHNITHFDQPN